MFKRLFFIWGLAMTLSLPVFAVDITAESKCDAETLNATESTEIVDVEAWWIPNRYSCDSGQYLNASNVTCESCLPGFYCVGFEPFDFDSENHGLTECPDTYGSESGAESITDCFKIITVTAEEKNPYIYGHGTPVYRNDSADCKLSYGDENCELVVPDSLDIIALNCDPGYGEDTIDGDLRCVRTGAICAAGTYLPVGEKDCAVCPADSYCGGGLFLFSDSEDGGRNVCASGLKSPVGAKSIKDCGHILHIGENETLYLHSDKRTEPSLVVDIDGVPYYANMTKIEDGAQPISPNSTKILRMTVDGKEYTVHTNIADVDE